MTEDLVLKHVGSKRTITPEEGALAYTAAVGVPDEMANPGLYPELDQTKYPELFPDPTRKRDNYFVFKTAVETGDYVVQEYKNGQWVDVTNDTAKWTRGVRSFNDMISDISGPSDTVNIARYGLLAKEMGQIAKKLADLCYLTKTSTGEIEQLTADQVTKVWGPEAALSNKESAYKASYTVTYHGVGPYGAIVDTPSLPTGARLLGARVVEWRNEFNNVIGASCTVPYGQSEFRIDDCAPTDAGPSKYADLRMIKELPPNADGTTNIGSHEYDVEVVFARDPDVYTKAYPNPDANVCDVSNGDVVNIARMGDREAIACDELPRPDPRDLRLRARKTDLEDNETLLDNAAFEIRWTDNDGTAHIQPLVFSEGMYQTPRSLTTGVRYSLVETKAPTWERKDGTEVSYNLLVEPIDFVLNWNADEGRAEIRFYDGDLLTNSAPLAGIWTDSSCAAATGAKDVCIQVANVRVGDLPKTGGNGVFASILAGLLILLGGAYAARRRSLS